MKSYKGTIFLCSLFIFLGVSFSVVRSQNRDHLPRQFREYTSPDQVVTFGRNTSFSRAIDVINQFAQKYRGKLIIDRTNTQGNIGISVPAMNFMDALKLILQVKNLALVEKKDYYQIVKNSAPSGKDRPPQARPNGKVQGKEPIATTHTREVRINATFFQGNKRALQEVGVDWSTISKNVPEALLKSATGGSGGGSGGSGGGGGGGGSQQNRPVPLPNSQFDGPFVEVNSKGARSVSQNVFNSVINFGEIGDSGIDVQALFSAFQADNLGQILGSPTIKVQDGKQGRIQVGEDFSIKQRDIAGNVTEKFFSVGTILTVTPHVITDNDTTFIHLKIHAERSSAQPDPVSTIIKKQQAETDALLLNGETTAIAGLYSTEKTTVRKGIPILKDLPPWFFGLRYLFGYTSKDYQTKELVVLVKASLEPRISERFNAEHLDSKYEVLRKEREKIRANFKRQKDILDNNKFNKKYDDPESKKQLNNKHDRKMNSSIKMNKKEVHSSSAAENKKTEAEAKSKKVNGVDVAKSDSKKEGMTTTQTPKTKVGSNHGIKNSKTVTKAQSTSKMNDTSAENNGMDMASDVPVPNIKSPSFSVDKRDRLKSPKAEQTVKQNYDHAYYVVAGAFHTQNNAAKYENKLRAQGYHPFVIQKRESDLVLVVYSGYNSFDKAQSKNSAIQENSNPNAWLYKVN